MLNEILFYLRKGRKQIPHDKLAAKMAQISARKFASSVYQFYQDTISNSQRDLKEETND